MPEQDIQDLRQKASQQVTHRVQEKQGNHKALATMETSVDLEGRLTRLASRLKFICTSVDPFLRFLHTVMATMKQHTCKPGWAASPTRHTRVRHSRGYTVARLLAVRLLLPFVLALVMVFLTGISGPSASTAWAQDTLGQCNRLAESELDPWRTGQGVPDRALDAGAVMMTCEAALDEAPHDGKLWYQYGRGLLAADETAAAAGAFQRAQKLNYPMGAFALGQLYAKGHDVVPQSGVKAVDYFLQAARTGVPAAAYEMGMVFYDGKGVERDFAVAAYWMALGAQSGYTPAMRMLGVLYFNGEGVERDRIQGQQWVKQAAIMGDPQAPDTLEQMLSVTMTKQPVSSGSADLTMIDDFSGELMELTELVASTGVLGIFLIVVVLVAIIAYLVPLRLWITAWASGAYVGLLTLVAMRLRRVPPHSIIKARISAVKAGLQIPLDELESHFLAGGNVVNVVNAIISADKANIELTFKRAAAIDLAGRDVLDAVQMSVLPKVIQTPRNAAVAQDGIQLIAIARVTVRTNLDRLVGGAGEDTVLARVGEGMVSAIGSAVNHKDVLEKPDSISKRILSNGLDSGTAYEILSIDIADIDVGKNIGAALQIEQANADKQIAQAKAEERRAMAVALEQEMRARVVESEAQVPKAMADAFRAGMI